MTKGKDRSPLEQIELTRNTLAFLLVAAFISFTGVLLWKGIPEENEQLLSYMLGQISGMALLALGFYFVNKVGQDALDAKRTENTGKLAEAITATANASTLATDGPIDVNVTNPAESPVPTVEGKTS